MDSKGADEGNYAKEHNTTPSREQGKLQGKRTINVSTPGKGKRTQAHGENYSTESDIKPATVKQ